MAHAAFETICVAVVTRFVLLNRSTQRPDFFLIVGIFLSRVCKPM